MGSGNKKNKILLIGGSGFIGLHLAKRLTDLDKKVTILCRNPEKVKKLEFAKSINLVKGDVTDFNSVKESIKNKDVIINLASVVNSGPDFNPYPDLDANLKGQLNVLEARKKFNPNSKFIFIGSRAQFGKVAESDLPVAEDQCQMPVSLYGIHKQAAENYCRLYKKAFNLNSIILRLSIVYGYDIIGENKFNTINNFIKEALMNQKIHVHGYGKDVKDLLYVEDLADLMIKVIGSNVNDGIFNVGSGKKITLLNIVKKIIVLCGSGSFESVPFPKESIGFELGSFYFDISKVKNTFGWAPKTSVDEGLRETIEFYRSRGKK